MMPPNTPQEPIPTPDGSLYRCPACGCRTLTERAGFEICPVCFWEGDGQDSHDADEVRGAPNGSLSLTQARIHKSFESESLRSAHDWDFKAYEDASLQIRSN